jgi:hypothetical protein
MEQVRPRYRSAESRARMGPDGVASRRRLFFVHKASERAYKIGNSEGMAVQCGGSGRKGSMSRCWHCSRWRASSCWPMATSIPSGLPAIRAVGRLRRLPQRSRPPTRRHPVKTIRAGSARISAPSAPASAWPVRWSCRRLRRCCPVAVASRQDVPIYLTGHRLRAGLFHHRHPRQGRRRIAGGALHGRPACQEGRRAGQDRSAPLPGRARPGQGQAAQDAARSAPPRRTSRAPDAGDEELRDPADCRPAAGQGRSAQGLHRGRRGGSKPPRPSSTTRHQISERRTHRGASGRSRKWSCTLRRAQSLAPWC